MIRFDVGFYNTAVRTIPVLGYHDIRSLRILLVRFDVVESPCNRRNRQCNRRYEWRVTDSVTDGVTDGVLWLWRLTGGSVRRLLPAKRSVPVTRPLSAITPRCPGHPEWSGLIKLQDLNQVL